MTTTRTYHGTREEWLNAFVEELRADFADVGLTIPKTRISIGYTGSRDRAGSHVLAACWHKAASKDATREVFVVPELDDSVRIGDVIVHELIHAALPDGEGHKAKTFGKAARALGLEGPLTATYAGDELRQRMEHIVRRIGDLPHAALNSGRINIPPRKPGEAPEGPTMPRQIPRQGTRQRKVECPKCGCVVRMTRKWLDKPGPPICACGTRMVEVDPPKEDDPT